MLSIVLVIEEKLEHVYTNVYFVGQKMVIALRINLSWYCVGRMQNTYLIKPTVYTQNNHTVW